jgi:hypothetical protein
MVLAIEIIILAVLVVIGVHFIRTRDLSRRNFDEAFAAMNRFKPFEIARNTGGNAHDRRLARRHLERAANLGNA